MRYNPQMLKLARELRGYTQAQLSASLNVAQGTISKIEKLGSGFDNEIAIKLSSFLNIPISFFESKDVIIPIQGEYRKKISTTVRQYNQNNALMTIVERQLLKLLEGIEINPNEIPVWDVEAEGSPKLCAQYLRKRWKLARGRINDLTILVENSGAIIIPLPLVDMDGFSMYTTNGIPLIFINRDISADRARLTLAHELGHIIMHLSCKVSDDRDKEREAFEFGAELLMPELEIKPQLTRLNLAVLADLKKYWKTSMQSIVRRAKDLGMLTDNQYKYLWIQMGVEGFKVREPIFFSAETPTTLKQIIDAYKDEMDYSTEEIASLIDASREDFSNIYFQTRVPTLRKLY